MTLTILLVLALAGLVFGFMQLRSSPQTAKPMVYGMLVVVLVLLVVRMFSGCGRSPGLPFTDAFEGAAAYKLGQEVARTVPAGSEVLVLHAGELNEGMKQITAAQLEGLRRGFGSTAYAVVSLGPQNEADAMRLLAEPFLSLPYVAEQVRAHPQAKAVVSFLGAPVAETGRPLPKLPPLYVVGQSDPGMCRELIDRGLIRAGVFVKADVDWRAKPGRRMPPDDVFDMRYELITSTR